jgi:F-type H+-transporting ATPase subunit c
MTKSVFNLFLLVLAVLLVTAVPAVAKDNATDAAAFCGMSIGAGLGAAITLLGAGYGFGKIGSAALESMARQPEVAPRLFTTMLLIGALLEGATFFSLIVCILVLVL